MVGDIGGGSPRLRVAIVGLGPKGFYALERLLHHAHVLGPRAALEVDVFEPAACPGAGPVYDPVQPAYLRMNLAADRLSMWPAGSRAVPVAERLSFVDWRASDEEGSGGGHAAAGDGSERFPPRAQAAAAGAGSGRFPPRAQVGRYLARGLAAMLRAAPPEVRIELRPAEILAACREGSGWRLFAAGDPVGRVYDEVLVATGHRLAPQPSLDDGGPQSQAVLGDGAARIPADLDAAGPQAQAHLGDAGAQMQADLGDAGPQAQAVLGDAGARIPAVFPVTRWLSRDRVPAGATVAVRGFALTFIDAALALTEGRGGRFSPDGHPYRLRYEPSGEDAGLILPFSRSGRPMLAKPEPGLLAGVRGVEAIARAGRDEILDLAPGFAVRKELVAILAATAAASLRAASAAHSGEDPRPAPPSRSREDPRSAPSSRSSEDPRSALRSRSGEEQRFAPTARSGEEPRLAPAARSGHDPLDAARAAGDWLAAACDGRVLPAGLTPAAEIERSLAIGAGLHPPDLQWALGHAWRSVYPALVARLSGSAMAADEWVPYRRLAAQMERLAFGPPAINAAKLLALIDAGRVDLTYVAGGRITTTAGRASICGDDGGRDVDVVIDAVLPGPGAAGSPLLATHHRRRARTHRRRAAGRRGHGRRKLHRA